MKRLMLARSAIKPFVSFPIAYASNKAESMIPIWVLVKMLPYSKSGLTTAKFKRPT
ncbi:MAG: hypothetical protein BWX66_01989 [Deltaproteobacteria bacterium ADurb.Bin058]|nr:MAG: hypothetical protein BWX66_01989 [Deltaproteobacteria bacterium ADurb.Bin058]